MKLNNDLKEKALETMREYGTMKAAATAAGVSVKTLNREMRRSAIFKRRLLEAREQGKRNIADNAMSVIMSYAFNPAQKTDRNRLTACLALCNAYEPGFKGTTHVDANVNHNVRVLTSIPRPAYPELDPPKPKQLKGAVIEGVVIEKQSAPQDVEAAR